MLFTLQVKCKGIFKVIITHIWFIVYDELTN